MKTIKNISMQGLSLPFGTPKGPKSIFLAPREQVEVPDGWVCRVVENLVHRRMVKMTITENPPAPTPAPTPVKKVTKPAKKTNKSS